MNFRDLLPAEVRADIEAKEAAGISLEEQGRIRHIEPVRPRAPLQPVETREMDALFGTTVDPQTGDVKLRMIEGGKA